MCLCIFVMLHCLLWEIGQFLITLKAVWVWTVSNIHTHIERELPMTHIHQIQPHRASKELQGSCAPSMVHSGRVLTLRYAAPSIHSWLLKNRFIIQVYCGTILNTLLMWVENKKLGRKSSVLALCTNKFQVQPKLIWGFSSLCVTNQVDILWSRKQGYLK